LSLLAAVVATQQIGFCSSHFCLPVRFQVENLRFDRMRGLATAREQLAAGTPSAQTIP
jgi:hypothetical protein